MTDSYGAQAPAQPQPNVGGDIGGQLTGVGVGQQARSPVFQKPREPWIPPSAGGARPSSEWGKPDPYAQQAKGYGQADTSQFMPQGADIQPLLRGALGHFSKNGSPGVSNAAMMMLFANNDFLQSYMKAREWRMRMADQEMDAQRKRVIDLQQRESEDYGRAFDLARRDPKHFKDGLEKRLWEIAKSYNDTSMQKALAAGGIEAAEALNKTNDGHLRSLLQYTQQVDAIRAQEDAEQIEREKLGTAGTSSSPSRPAATTPVTAPGTTGTTLAAPGAAAVPSGATPSTPTPPGGLAPPVAPSEYIKQQVHRALSGEKVATGDTERVQNAVGDFQAKQEEYFDKLASGTDYGTQVKADGTPDVDARKAQLLPMIDQADETVGRRTRDILSGAVPSAAKASSEDWAIPIALAGKIDPRFSAPRIEATRETMKQRYELQETTRALGDAELQLGRIHAVVAKNVNDMKVLQILAEKPTRFGMPALDAWAMRGRANVLGDPDVAALNTQIELVRSDAARILGGGASGTGMIPVYQQKEMHALISGGATPEQIRRISGVLISDYIGRVNGLTGEINSLRAQRHEGPIPDDPLVSKLVGLPELSAGRPITTKEEYDALPVGAVYIKNGKRYRKK
jgi:hypothetical protein